MFSGSFLSSSQGLEDAGNYIWLLWHATQGLLGKNSLFFTNLLFFPQGASLKFDAPILNTIISLPVSILSGPIAAYNFVILFSFVATFLGFFLFLNYLSRSRFAALVGSLIFTFSAYRLTVLSLGQIDLLSTNWIGFTLYYLFKYFDGAKFKKNLLLASVFFALGAYTDYRTFIVTTLVIAFVLFMFIIQNKKTRAETFRKSLYFLLTSSLLISPILLIQMKNILVFPTFIEVDSPRLSITDLLVYAFPFKSLTSFYFSMATPFIGIVPVLLLPTYFLFFNKVKKVKKINLIFIYMAIIFAILSLGNGISIYKNILFESNYMPYSLLKTLPIFTFLRSPARLSLGVQIAISVLTTIAIKQFMEEIKRKYLRITFMSIVIFFAVFSNFIFIPKINIYKAPNAEILSTLKNKTEGTVLFIPFGFADSFDQPNGVYNTNMLLTQMYHGKPIIGGYLSRVEIETLNDLHIDIFIDKLLACQKRNICNNLSQIVIQKTISKYNLKYFIFETKSTNPSVEDFLIKNFSLKEMTSNFSYKIMQITN